MAPPEHIGMQPKWATGRTQPYSPELQRPQVAVNRILHLALAGPGSVGGHESLQRARTDTASERKA
jgi:hypothetical protein